jgi:hypothetical protein
MNVSPSRVRSGAPDLEFEISVAGFQIGKIRGPAALRARLVDWTAHPVAQDPGAPPQRPHIGASDPDVDPFDELTANTLMLRAVSPEPHDGHFTFASPAADIDRTSCSNFPLHD